jgi:hypothetical protein
MNCHANCVHDREYTRMTTLCVLALDIVFLIRENSNNSQDREEDSLENHLPGLLGEHSSMRMQRSVEDL